MTDEIPERSAEGKIAELYAEIRSTTRVPLINLIFRRLAAIDGALDWAWHVLRPAYACGALERAGAELVSSIPLPDERLISPLELQNFGIGPADGEDIALILESYVRGNAMNIIAMTALFRAITRGSQTGDPTAELPSNWISGDRMESLREPRRLLAMDDLSEEVRTLVARLNALGSRGGQDSTSPSLYRHLGYWPALLSAVYERLQPLESNGSLASLSERCCASANEMAIQVEPILGVRDLRSLTEKTKDKIKNNVSQFGHITIPRLLPICVLLRRSFD